MAAASSENINTSIADSTVDRSALTGICVGMDTSAVSPIKNHFGHVEPVRAHTSTLGIMPDAPVFPDAHLTCLRHEEKAQDKANRRNGDRIDECIGETAGRLKGRRGDERAPSRRPSRCRSWTPLCSGSGRGRIQKEGADRPVRHAHKDGNRHVDIAGLRG
jgi:hypothetical protein